MEVNIEVPDVAGGPVPSTLEDAEDQETIDQAVILDIPFEEGDEIEEGELLAVVFNEYGMYEIVAPASGLITSLRCDEGDTVTSGEVLATIDTDR
jgi:2-oxoglutarate dehydrogenase E2 component (dihydrolipoamide succinyltransferase)